MTVQPPQTIYNAVNPIAIQYGVPTQLWEDVAYTESGYNPQAVGDTGTSFGIFQLHEGGQLPAGVSGPSTFDPTLNARLAMPAIARAWNNLKSTFNPTSSSWWQSFAAQSGHPGGAPGQSVTINEATKLQSGWSGGGSIPVVSGVQDAINAATSGTDPVSAFSGQAGIIVQNLTTPSFWIRIGIGVAAIVLIVLALLYFVKDSAPAKGAEHTVKKSAMVAPAALAL